VLEAGWCVSGAYNEGGAGVSKVVMMPSGATNECNKRGQMLLDKFARV